MTVYLENNSFKYEIEAVLKLFRPLERFTFVQDAGAEKGSDRVIAAVDKRLYVYADINGVNREMYADIPSAVKETETEMGRMIFLLLREITGICPEWGCLTGIRPVKMVNTFIEQGMTEKEIYALLKEKYFVSEKKAALAYLTAVTQAPLLKDFDKRSYSLYISVPFCPSRCSYCSFVSHSIQSPSAKKLVPEYVDKLCEEIRVLGRIMRDKDAFCSTVYIGGGTPTSLSAEQIAKIMETTAENIDISAVSEYTVEAGRADTITEEKLAAIKKGGAGRVSVNPQTLNDEVLRVIGRNHTAQQALDCIALAKSMGFDSVNADIIAGLPADTPESFGNTVTGLIASGADNITVHTLTVKRAARLSADRESVKREILPDDQLSGMVNFAFDALCGAGYSPYYLYRQKNTVGNLENVGYAKKGSEGLYNIYIMEECQNILACGAGGSTKLIDFGTGRITRRINHKYPYEYISRYDEITGYKKETEDYYNR